MRYFQAKILQYISLKITHRHIYELLSKNVPSNILKYIYNIFTCKDIAPKNAYAAVTNKCSFNIYMMFKTYSEINGSWISVAQNWININSGIPLYAGSNISYICFPRLNIPNDS